MSDTPFRHFDLNESLICLHSNALFRQRHTLTTAQGPDVAVAGKHYLNFCSNDYLGLAADAEVSAAAEQGVKQFGVGSGASHMVCGHSEAHQYLEQALAEWVGRSRALLFSSGYMANVGVIQALLGRHDHLFQDRLNHASLIDGGRISGARSHRFRHADVGHLEALLNSSAGACRGRGLIVTDSVFSMDGDVAPLAGIADVARPRQAWLMVDEAHALGVLGKEGAGAVVDAQLSEAHVPIVVGTLGKALGTAGAFVAGSTELIEFLIQRARTYMYTTALPPSLCMATLKSLEIARQDEGRRAHLRSLIGYFREQAEHYGLPLLHSETAIQPLMIGEAGAAHRCSEQLKSRGIWVAAIRPPTVPKGSARLRITLTAVHTEAMIDQLVDALVACVR